jgi:hypothetical protein
VAERSNPIDVIKGLMDTVDTLKREGIRFRTERDQARSDLIKIRKVLARRELSDTDRVRLIGAVVGHVDEL